MFEDFQICPYTGLRSFTEEESLYFKGREEHIEQATLQLQRNKFLMLTGASGDGKSSLVYAGIVPNARAGFLKAKYTQWHVADFRPERTPFKNLCKTLTRQLDITNSEIVESELQHGFSALIDLYKNSDCFLDTNSPAWNHSDDKQKAVLKRKTANLLIIVDQFEEFFTNPENYHQGVPSRDANLVLNLLLETARIALEENLPVYIVFTMRSDYIGQCAAFRSLPEYLGFSQFFVPRLNRLQLQQVIEEPAALSGNRITRRLTERLIHDIAEGVDQLPILQHALNQIWHAANKGTEEMDLIHYAMVSGMSASELPDEQLNRFNTWFDQLPEEIKKCYHRPDLQNVLDTHANKLYESAEEEFLKKTGKYISDSDSKQIIKMAFSCLTKIDQSRAVRNRMTLQEIHQILNNKSIDVETINQVLNVFREPGNTFIRPFITDDPESANLGAENILDITHESLIRNWDLLKTWAKEEYDSYLISQDFEQQLGRWVESGKSNNYLLSIGPLTYFENWYNKVKPNTWWIARYLPEEDNQGDKHTKAEVIQNDSVEFLKRSAQQHLITRTVMKVGPKRIAVALGLLLILIFSSFMVSNYLKKQNDSVLKVIKQEALSFANEPKLGLEYNVPVLIQEIELGHLTIPEIIQSVKDPLQKIWISIGISELLIAQGWYQPGFEIYQSISIADSLLEAVPVTQEDPKLLSTYLKENNNFRVALGFASIYNPAEKINVIARHNALRSGRWVMNIFQKQPKAFKDFQNLTLALENAINYKGYTSEEIIQFIKTLSPFEGSNRSEWINQNFHGDNLLVRGSQDYAFKSNGLYQELAYLYATIGDADKALRCIDSLLLQNQNYYQNDYESLIDNATNIVGVFFAYDQKEALEKFVDGYCIRKKIPVPEFYNRTISRFLVDYGASDNYNFYSVTGATYSNLNLKFCTEDLIPFLFNKMRQRIDELPDQDERNFSLAMAYKNEGTMLSLRKETRGQSQVNNEFDTLFQNAVDKFKLVSSNYLSKMMPVIFNSGADQVEVSAKFLFLYPDYFVPFPSGEPRRYIYMYNTPAFIEFILKKDLMKSLFQVKEDFKPFELWLSNYHAVSISRDYFMREAIPYNTLVKLAEQLEKTKAGEAIDLNLIYLYLGNNAFLLNQSDSGINYYNKIQPEKVLNAFRYKGLTFLNEYSMEQYAIAIANLYSKTKQVKGYELINVFKNKVNRSSLYAFAAQMLSSKAESKPIAQNLIDSAKAEMNRITNPAVFQPNRHQIAIALLDQDDDKFEPEAQRIIKNAINKFDALFRFSRSHATHGNLYKAYMEIPSDISNPDKAYFLYNILLGHTRTLEQKEPWEKFEQNIVFPNRFFLPYINEND